MHRPTMYYYWLGRLVSPFNRLQHSGLKWLKPAKNKFYSCDLMNFSKQVKEDSSFT